MDEEASGMQGGAYILPDVQIKALVDAKHIGAARRIAPAQIQPASLDLRLGEAAYRVRASFLPRPGGRMRDAMRRAAAHRLDLREGAIMETGCVYLAQVQERLSLPPELAARANPKSSIGRADVFVRVLSEKGGMFDAIEPGYRGPLYLEISPRSFPVRVEAGLTMAQLRFWRSRASPPLKLVSSGDVPLRKDLPLHADLRPPAPAQPIGYRARKHTRVLDLSARAQLAVKDFWEEIYAEPGDALVLEPESFYILAAREPVTVPDNQAAEMRPFDPLIGEFRVHYAGFFDPGFGGGAGKKGAKAVLEVRSREVPFLLRDGQTIGHLRFMPLTASAQHPYHARTSAHYNAQGLRLSKHFRQ